MHIHLLKVFSGQATQVVVVVMEGPKWVVEVEVEGGVRKRVGVLARETNKSSSPGHLLPMFCGGRTNDSHRLGLLQMKYVCFTSFTSFTYCACGK